MKKEERINTYLDIVFRDFPEIARIGIKKCLVSSKYLKSSADIEPSSKGVQRLIIPNKVIINTGRVIISDIDKSLVDKYDAFVNENNIVIRKSELYDFLKDHRAYYDRAHNNGDEPRIVMYKQPDFYSVCILIHEFMHSTNIKKIDKKNPLDNKDIFRNELSEFVSIYFEMYAREYLINKLNVNNNMIDISERFISNFELANYDICECISYIIYSRYREVNYENYLKVLEEFDIPLMPNMKDYSSCINKINHTIKKVYNIITGYSELNKDDPDLDELEKSLSLYLRSSILDDNYVLSSLLYFSVKDKLSKEDILKFNNILGDNTEVEEKINNPDFQKIMNYYNSILVDETAFDNLEHFLKSVYDEKGRIRKNYVM